MVNFAKFCLLLSLCATLSLADEQERTYKRDESGQNRSGRKYDGQVLDNTNFGDATLKGTSFRECNLTSCNFGGASLESTELYGANLTGSDFRGAKLVFPTAVFANFNQTDFEGCNFSQFTLSNNKFHLANLRNAQGVSTISNCEFTEANLCGADLSRASIYKSSFVKAKYDRKTRFPDSFDPDEAGMILVKEEPPMPAPVTPSDEPSPTDPKPNPGKKPLNGEALFTKLDANEDGVLSGKEMGEYKSRDANEDGDITVAEFLAGE